MAHGHNAFGTGVLAAAFMMVGFACNMSFEGPPPGSEPSTSDVKVGADAGESIKTTTGLPCAVSEVLSTNCQTCHGASPQSGASSPLVTWDDLQKDHGGKKLYDVVKERIHAESGQMPPAARLTDAQLKSIDDWVAAGTPKADATCDLGAGPPPATRAFECPAPAKVSVLKAATPFTWTSTSAIDQYMCFGVDEVVTAKRHVISLGPKIENLNIIHHVLLFQSDTAMPNEAQPCTAVTSAGWKLVAGWAPGGGNMVLPPEAGFPEVGTTHWVLQLHYNNASGTHAGESDNSGFQLCSTDQLRPNDAGILGFGSINFSIPPRTAKHRIKCDYELGAAYKDVTFFQAWPHMHTLGMGVATERLPGGKGTPETVFAQDSFTFENQENFKINTKAAKGDVFRTRCTWKNPGDMAVGFGEDTGDEMCFNFLSYYPAIPDVHYGSIPVQTWVTPAFNAQCSVDNN